MPATISGWRNLRQQVLALRGNKRGQVAARILHHGRDALHVAERDGKHVPVFVEDGPQRVHQLRALMDKPLTSPEHHRLRLLIGSLRRHKPHLRLARRDHDRLGVGRIILLTLDERPDILRRDQPNLVPECYHLSCPVARASAGLEHHKRGRLCRHESPKLIP